MNMAECLMLHNRNTADQSRAVLRVCLFVVVVQGLVSEKQMMVVIEVHMDCFSFVQLRKRQVYVL